MSASSLSSNSRARLVAECRHGDWNLLPEGRAGATRRIPEPTAFTDTYPAIDYPDLNFTYKVRVHGEGGSIRIIVDFPDIVSADYMLNALNFMLGVHPGSNTASFASGVGARSTIVAYGFNRADSSYIPGGVVSGTALIRRDTPELKDSGFLWQQRE